MQTKTFLAAVLAALPAAQTFKFTGPDPSEPIDVSKEVTITWEGDIPDSLSRKFDFTWYCEPDHLNKLSSDISHLVDEIYLSDHKYKFRFHNSKSMLEPFADKVAAKKVFSFQAVFTDENQDYLELQYWSQNYTIIGLNKKEEQGPEVDL
ncbi:hypothetical protein H9Q69_000321 [Fusarium xylarioides]|uniref:Uncharacterized protein n=1 Tax=Fusarium xylarioides TaxID=221167 RepID=A0A9P7LJ82_9HYPO|nr:hypothetical protein H9Q70_008651 [Fusarium xylarioides]KAG5769332.1 hypothetical protein H9Q72_003426 [Fusarium xylarioides]KAG5777801.1 hypothetical protein H9Q73_008553 [Fusarium xylarioides]KAG5800762.1 hypothetical protein H9Q69_000321 [Fusarium xylarioides]KAG5804210.1 hypothetical protein H9Q71_011219 [Fusarium xylarioides]